jgi:hypothetical protein
VTQTTPDFRGMGARDHGGDVPSTRVNEPTFGYRQPHREDRHPVEHKGDFRRESMNYMARHGSDDVGQAEVADESVDGADAPVGDTTGSTGDVVPDVAGGEDGSVAVGEFGRVEALSSL